MDVGTNKRVANESALEASVRIDRRHFGSFSDEEDCPFGRFVCMPNSKQLPVVVVVVVVVVVER